jgi:drug/metabolite transporter (DMT)-like permease
MNVLGLYLSSVLIWGSTWLAITFQFGTVPPAVSVAYRFFLSALVLLGWCLVKRLPLRFTGAEHGWMLLQGILLFGINYVTVYLAETEVTSGLVAVVFSLIVFLNIAGTRIFFGTPIKPATLIGAVLGVSGILLVFLPEFSRETGKGDPTLGLVLALGGAVSASLGNLVVSRNYRQGLPVVQMNTFGMFYGALMVAGYALVTGQPFVFDPSPRYLVSLAYLALFGSILAFGAFLTLIGRIGADRAGYVTVAIPVVALLLSALFEGLEWHPSLVAGMLLCLVGNVAVLRVGGPEGGRDFRETGKGDDLS